MSTDAKYIAVITAGTPQVTCMYIIIYYRYTEWKGLWCSSTVWLLSTQTHDQCLQIYRFVSIFTEF